jgi:hypothetical protein
MSLYRVFFGIKTQWESGIPQERRAFSNIEEAKISEEVEEELPYDVVGSQGKISY